MGRKLWRCYRRWERETDHVTHSKFIPGQRDHVCADRGSLAPVALGVLHHELAGLHMSYHCGPRGTDDAGPGHECGEERTVEESIGERLVLPPREEMHGNMLVTVHPSFVEQMAYRHYCFTGALHSAVPWADLPRATRDLLVKVMSDIVGKVIDTCDD